MNLFFLLFISISSLSGLILSMIFGNLSIAIAVISFLLALVLSFSFSPKEKCSYSLFEMAGFSFVFLLCSFQFTFLIYEIRLDEIWLATINPNNRGDLPFHINMIKAFSRGLEFWPDHLFMMGERLRYPFAINLFNAQWDILGLPLKTHLMLTGLLCLAVLIRELYAWLGVWGLMCFFISGGWGSSLPGSDLEFKNLFLSVFVTQRGFLWALPSGIWLIRNFSQIQSSHKLKWVWIFILAVMPFFHLHSFVILWLYFCGLHFLQKGNWKIVPQELIFAGLGASPFILQAIWNNPVGNVVHFSSYWWQWHNFGAWGALATACLILMAKKKVLSREDLWSYVLLLVFSVFMLAPWDWDQIKILLWCYLLINAVMVKTLLKKTPKYAVAILAALVFFPGALQMYHSLPVQQFKKDRVYLVKTRDIKILEAKLSEISPNEVVFAAPIYNHPLFFIGQSVLIGYPGHAWSQALNPKPAMDYMEAIVDKGCVFESGLFKKQISWVLVSPFEKEKWPESSLFSSQDWSLFRVDSGQCR